MIKENQRLLNFFHFFTDITIVFCLMPVAHWIRFAIPGTSVDGYGLPFYLVVGAVEAAVLAVLYALAGLYRSFRMRGLAQELWRLFQADVLGMALIVTALFVLKHVHFSRWLLALYFLLIFSVTALKRIFMRLLLRRWRAQGRNLKHVLIVGGQETARRYFDSILSHRQLGLNPAGYVADSGALDLPQLGGYSDLSGLLSRQTFDEVVIALEPAEHALLDDAVAACESAGVKVSIIPYCHKYLTNTPQIDVLDGLPLINIRRIPLENLWNAFLKRSFDILASAVLLLLTSPVLLVAAVGVKLSSPGPILLRQERVGKNRKPFYMLKFRSMRVNDREGTGWSSSVDARRTPFGSFIRKFSIDELPQFINVLKGEMSLIGPRPELPHFVEQFKTEVPLYMVKHQVRPGITGWAQVNGLRGDSSIPERIRCDLYYIENWSVLLDLKILIRTACLGFINDEKVLSKR